MGEGGGSGSVGEAIAPKEESVVRPAVRAMMRVRRIMPNVITDFSLKDLYTGECLV
jgi:hypothetical protein